MAVSQCVMWSLALFNLFKLLVEYVTLVLQLTIYTSINTWYLPINQRLMYTLTKQQQRQCS